MALSREKFYEKNSVIFDQIGQEKFRQAVCKKAEGQDLYDIDKNTSLHLLIQIIYENGTPVLFGTESPKQFGLYTFPKHYDIGTLSMYLDPKNNTYQNITSINDVNSGSKWKRWNEVSITSNSEDYSIGARTISFDKFVIFKLKKSKYCDDNNLFNPLYFPSPRIESFPPHIYVKCDMSIINILLDSKAMINPALDDKIISKNETLYHHDPNVLITAESLFLKDYELYYRIIEETDKSDTRELSRISDGSFYIITNDPDKYKKKTYCHGKDCQLDNRKYILESLIFRHKFNKKKFDIIAVHILHDYSKFFLLKQRQN